MRGILPFGVNCFVPTENNSLISALLATLAVIFQLGARKAVLGAYDGGRACEQIATVSVSPTLLPAVKHMANAVRPDCN